MRLCSEKLVFDIRQRTLYLGRLYQALFTGCTWLVCVCCWHIACLLAFLRAPDSVSSVRKKRTRVHLNVRLTARPCPFTLSLSLLRDRDGQSVETTENRSSLTSQFAKTIEKHIHLFLVEDIMNSKTAVIIRNWYRRIDFFLVLENEIKSALLIGKCFNLQTIVEPHGYSNKIVSSYN